MTHSELRIVVNVFDGLIQDVVCSKDAEIIVIDWDIESARVEDGAIEVPLPDQQSTLAFVNHYFKILLPESCLAIL